MEHLIRSAESRLARINVPLSLRLPGGRTVGPPRADVTVEFSRWPAVALLAAGEIGKIAEGFVEDRIRIEGTMRKVMDVAAQLLPASPVPEKIPLWQRAVRRVRSAAAHSITRDAAQVQFHYDVSDDFYALWLDPKRVYSCAYFSQPAMTLAQAQEAKLDHICRKLMLRPGERFLDIGAGWGGLLLWAAEHYGVDATGITLSKNQHAHVTQLIRDKGLESRVRVLLCDYRDLAAEQPFDKIASVGMIEHVGQANLGAYFGKIFGLLAPGGLVLNHGITAAGPQAGQLGAGIGDFIEKYIFPGGELLHVSQLLREGAVAGLEMLDTENLRPHYARTLWAWSDGLEGQLGQALVALRSNGSTPAQAERVLRAYRLYLAGSAMSFERGWLSLHQMLATRPAQGEDFGNPPGAASRYPFTRKYMYP
ncbi:MAG: class I SAM-dependent methyltransferase [Rhodoferax sp.]|nr:class I SAM-dependent methyltransferase [Rhodoferax sp.]MCP5263873.1 class I SAM-dependent methyltransferase [Rhodoferax sp.]